MARAPIQLSLFATVVDLAAKRNAITISIGSGPSAIVATLPYAARMRPKRKG